MNIKTVKEHDSRDSTSNEALSDMFICGMHRIDCFPFQHMPYCMYHAGKISALYKGMYPLIMCFVCGRHGLIHIGMSQFCLTKAFAHGWRHDCHNMHCASMWPAVAQSAVFESLQNLLMSPNLTILWKLWDQYLATVYGWQQSEGTTEQ